LLFLLGENENGHGHAELVSASQTIAIFYRINGMLKQVQHDNLTGFRNSYRLLFI